ncbi:MAG: outer membrane murein-binding lipoprotein Lpp [Marinoscillum sp.]|jgi:outer membrane murein-binding lipoprotein Lpp
MLFLLRKIRRKLISTDNKIATYLLYAIGEIILVVIGILIAVKIDNWNSQQNQRAVEISHFINLKKDLFADINQLDSLINITQEKELAAKKIKARAKKREIGSLYHFS